MHCHNLNSLKYFLILLFLFSVSWSQEPQVDSDAQSSMAENVSPRDTNRIPSLQEVRELKASVEGGSLDELSKTALTGKYDELINKLERLQQLKSKEEEFGSKVRGAPERIDKLEQSLDTTENAVESFDDLTSPSVVAAEISARELELKSSREKLTNSTTSSIDRIGRQKELNERLVELRSAVEATPASPPPVMPDSNGEFETLSSWVDSTLEWVDSALKRTEIKALEEEKQYLDLAKRIDPLVNQLAERRIDILNSELEKLRAQLAEIREQRNETRKNETESIIENTDGVIANLGAENIRLLKEHTGPESIVRRINDYSKSIESEQTTLKSLRESFESTEQRLEIIGLNRDVAEMLRNAQKRLPPVFQVKTSLNETKSQLPDIQIRLLELNEEKRNLSRSLDEKVQEYAREIKAAQPDLPETELEEKRATVEELLQERLSILDNLTLDYEKLFQLALEKSTIQTELINSIEKYDRYISEKTFWIRTNSIFEKETWSNFIASISWLATPEIWKKLLITFKNDLLGGYPPLYATILVLISVIVLSRRMKAHVRKIRENDKNATSMKNFYYEVFTTIVLSLPLPIIFVIISVLLNDLQSSEQLSKALAVGFLEPTPMIFLITLYAQFIRPKGILRRHLSWPAESLKAQRFHLHWASFLILPFIILGIIIEDLGNSNNTAAYGVVVYPLIFLTSAVLYFIVLDPNRVCLRSLEIISGSNPLRILTNFFRYTLTILCLTSAVLAILGYYHISDILANRLLYSVLVAIFLLIIEALANRILSAKIVKLVQRTRFLRFKNRSKQKQKPVYHASQIIPKVESSEEEDYDSDRIARESKSFIRWTAVTIYICLLWLIWSDTFPVLSKLDTVYIYGAKSFFPSADEIDSMATGTVLSLSDVITSLVVIFFTVIITRNLPSLLEISILPRFNLSRSVRYAIASLSRYAIIIVGISMAFSAIGIGWSKVQWLAAAVSVGLGFGLQEIFANFVSGLIILIERPIRVGDTVTVGDVSGQVTSIRMRATVITDWDRRELLVPNREFVTGRLVNWTLSDTTSRIRVDVGVAYGSDTRKAREILEEIGRKHPHVLKDPESFAVFTGFGDSFLDVRLYCYLPNRDLLWPTLTDLHTEIDERFKEAQIEIAFPQRDVHLRSMDFSLYPKEEEVAKAKELYDEQIENDKKDEGHEEGKSS